MSLEYIPTTKQVRAAWNALTEAENERYRERGVDPVTEDESSAEFDRWLNQVKADAWDLGHEACQRDWEFAYDLITPDSEREPWTNPYREEAT